MLTLGYHTSTTAGFVNTMNEVKKYGANTFQFFTRNPRGSKARELDRADMEAFIREKKDFGPVVAHAAYTMNLASSREDVREKSYDIFASDMGLLAQYPEDTVYVFHPGSHIKDGAEVGVERIVRAMDRAKELFPHRAICLETMSGKGTEIGWRRSRRSSTPWRRRMWAWSWIPAICSAPATICRIPRHFSAPLTS